MNVSAAELADPTFVDRFLDYLERHALPVGRIAVEVTETAVAVHVDVAAEVLRRLRAAGVHVALDDFGTGHASLDYLARLPCDGVKIDRSFVAGLGTDSRCEAIVAGVVAMAHATGHEVVAEGVETHDQLTVLLGLECDEAQGFLYGRPGPAHLVPRQRRSASAAQGSSPRLSASTPLESTERAQWLVDVVRDVSAAPDLVAAFAVVVTALRGRVRFTGGSVQVLGPDGIRLAAAHPPPTAQALAMRIPAGQGVGGAVCATGQVRYLPDITVPAAAVEESRRSRSTTRHTRSYLAVPLFAGSECVGLVQLDSVEPDAFDAEVHLLLAACAAPLAGLLRTGAPRPG